LGNWGNNGAIIEQYSQLMVNCLTIASIEFDFVKYKRALRAATMQKACNWAIMIFFFAL
jgi:hypothetical protein